MKLKTKLRFLENVVEELQNIAAGNARALARNGCNIDPITMAQDAIESLELSDDEMTFFYFDSMDKDGFPVHDGGIYEYLIEKYLGAYHDKYDAISR